MFMNRSQIELELKKWAKFFFPPFFLFQTAPAAYLNSQAMG